MINGKRVLAIIPARAGSKRLPKKNLRNFRGRTLIEWAHEAAIDSHYIDTIVLSSEDAEILAHADAIDLSRITRPAILATDDATCEDVVRHAHAETCHPDRKPRGPYDWIIVLQPTSPLRTAADIDGCIERAQMGYGCISINRSSGQANGAVYVARSSWLVDHDFSHQGLMKYPMPPERSVDIDTEEDWQLAERYGSQG